MALFKSRKRAPTADDPGLTEIAAWETWFRHAHAERLADPLQFPDRHLVDDERARIDALTTAVVATMREQYLVRPR
jgi:hypothetical protein